MQKWSYVCVEHVSTSIEGEVFIVTPDGKRKKHCKTDHTTKDVLPVLNKLGDQGYELIGVS